jgi:hypothetical protein
MLKARVVLLLILNSHTVIDNAIAIWATVTVKCNKVERLGIGGGSQNTLLATHNWTRFIMDLI